MDSFLETISDRQAYILHCLRVANQAHRPTGMDRL
jgi:hypothetical protein